MDLTTTAGLLLAQGRRKILVLVLRALTVAVLACMRKDVEGPAQAELVVLPSLGSMVGRT